jgi:hypothetical protein
MGVGSVDSKAAIQDASPAGMMCACKNPGFCNRDAGQTIRSYSPLCFVRELISVYHHVYQIQLAGIGCMVGMDGRCECENLKAF